jgi:lipopolysaccharide/colanic/teichoic acid biosynthesis glycosyltransferase
MTQSFGESVFDAESSVRGPWRASSSFASVATKRGVDIVLSSTLLCFLSPVIVLVCVATKLDSRGPVFYRASRVGWRGQTLEVLKFRKMLHGAAGQPLTEHDDPRFTRIGRVLARTKLDELPQLWNVLRGQMSLVGPRPEDPGFVALHEVEYREILNVRPGVTGLGQLAFSNEAEILSREDAVGHYIGVILPQKVLLDRFYARGWTIRGDLSILLWTILPVVMRVDVAVNRRSGALTVRRRRGSGRSG